ncbi:sugar ABC transporter substrate-binding protein [Paenibacillus baekrokdamisoli]|uniref:Sugar ABC transporter substrate-binding protein n=1 Tax=Paenibacillus baekrokdamisoli TaxID=1712516 RepID=A0A3G9IW20_9BACL|nr:substrate-binding domain-containing protein [Paenibacillus baekrokdamisoli]MBB3067857.1 ribose transport system substrate-binding protein [Paenibacillus baekrokdamisoli]BBH23097.1 sugar ABC transporter substrate-binding protein [Paenibacillus baekrokdamisoli]
MKKLFTVLIAIVFISSLAACGGKSADSPTSEAATKSVAILTPFLSSVTTNEMVESFKKQAKDRGWKTNVVDTKGDMGQLASRMEDVISTKADAIILVSTDPNQVKTQIEKASENKIPVFGIDSGYITGMVTNATSDNVEMSKLISDYLFKTIGNKGNLVVLTYRAHPGVLKRTLQLDDMLKQSTDIKKITEQQVIVPGPIENSRKQMESLLLANKDNGAITAVWTGWDEPAIGAAQAIEAAGRKDIVVTGIDGNSQAIEMIKKGSPLIATVKQNFVGMSEIVAKQIDLVFQGKAAEGTELYAPASLITKENAGK